MATVSITAGMGGANGIATAGTVDQITCANFIPPTGFMVGVFPGEVGEVVVSVNPNLVGTAGDLNGGEPGYDGRDVIVTKSQLVRSGGKDNKTIYITALAGSVPYWVTVV